MASLSLCVRFLAIAITVMVVSEISPAPVIVRGELCRKFSPNQTEPQEFECPKLFQSKRKLFCCFPDSARATCCEYNPRSKANATATSNSIILVIVGLASGLLFGLLLYICRVCEHLPMGNETDVAFNTPSPSSSSSFGSGFTGCAGGSNYRVAYHVNRPSGSTTTTNGGGGAGADNLVEPDSAPPSYHSIFPENEQEPLKRSQSASVVIQREVLADSPVARATTAAPATNVTEESNRVPMTNIIVTKELPGIYL